MATFTFRWPHDAEEVYVTGTFDGWSKSEKLEKVGNVFEKTVRLPDASEKIFYKFVVDNVWVADHAAPKERDPEGNENNVLLPKDMSKHENETGPSAAILNTVAPESTTAQLAGAVPLEGNKDDGAAAAILNTVTPESTTAQLAGAVPLAKTDDTPAALLNTVTPESTTTQLAGAVPIEDKTAILSPPGSYPETPGTDLDKEISVNPLPAANGALNPIKLAPGEKIPEGVAAGSTTDNVTLDKESYEKSDRLPGDDKQFSVKPLPATEGALNPVDLAPGDNIPDGANAGNVTDNVKLDKESYEKSDRLPGDDKQFSVSPLPATEGALNPIDLAPGAKIPDQAKTGSVTENVTLDQESYEKSDRLPGPHKEFSVNPLPAMPGAVNPAPTANSEFSVKPLPATEGALNPIKLAPGEKIPEGVTAGNIADNVTLDKESYEKSDRIPGLETELPPISGNMIPESSLPIVGTADVTIDTVTPGSTTATLAGKVPLEKATQNKPVEVSTEVPVEVKDSIKAAGENPEAATNTAAVEEKKQVEAELLKEVKKVEPDAKPAADGDVKPEPAAATSNGVTSIAPSAPETPAKPTETGGAESTPSDTAMKTAEKKKRHRLSAIFSKLKHKVSSKDK